MTELQDITQELWTGQGALVESGEKPDDATELLFKEYNIRKHPEFRNILLARMQEQDFFIQFPGFQFVKATLEFFLREMAGKKIKRCSAELDIAGECPFKYSSRRGGIARIRTIVGANMTREGETQYRVKMFPMVPTERGNLQASAEQNPELTRKLAKQFRIMYEVLQDMGYLARD